MIKGAFIINNHGKARLIKCYERIGEEEQQALVRQIFQLVSKRPHTACNFVEGQSVSLWPKETRYIYRHYATLYFIFAVDQSESELGILDLVQVFVETLDKCFESVCELDLIFNSNKVHYILDEIVQGGMVLETSIPEVLKAITEQRSLTESSRSAPVKR